MDGRTEKKLSDLSGMNKAANEILQQAWERGRKYGNEEKKDADKSAIEILANYEKSICDDCLLRPCGVPCRLLTALRYAIRYMKGNIEQ